MVDISNVGAKWTWGHLLFLDVEDHIEKHGHMREVPECALCELVETWECDWFLVSQKHFAWWWQLIFNCIRRHTCALHYRPINSNPQLHILPIGWATFWWQKVNLHEHKISLRSQKGGTLTWSWCGDQEQLKIENIPTCTPNHNVQFALIV
jgi:hypothetical protein